MPSQDPSSAAVTGPLQIGEVFAGRYEVLQLLGNGGTSTVYKVWDRLPREIIALKLIDPSAAENPKVLDYFKRELSLARRLSHRNVVRIHDLAEHRGQLYISMEYIEGRTLAALLAQRQRLSAAQFLLIFDQLCDGLGYVHSRGVIHRDIKPQNIMADKDGTLKLMDFGLARSVSSRPTMGIAVGTPAYMSPEQIMGQPLTNASDIYACGAMFLEMLTGQRPLAAMNWADRCTAKPPQFAPDVHGIPSELVHAIRKCMEPDPAQRFQTVEDLVAATKRAEPPAPRTTFVDLCTEEPGELGKVIPLFSKAVAVLAGIHRSGSAHLELAPRSIKIAESGEVQVETTTAAVVGGTVAIREPKYSAPDMSKGVAADIYSLGFIFYEILLGWRAFRIEFESVLKQGSELSWLEWHADVDKAARPLHDLLPGFSRDLSDAIAMMIVKQPDRRFQSLSAVANALRFQEPGPKVEVKRAEAQPHRMPVPSGARPPVPKALLIGGGVAIAVLVSISTLFFRRTPAPKLVPVVNAVVKPPLVQPSSEDLAKSIDTASGAMMLIPDGEFLMGAPGAAVKLPAFYIDKTEVTNTAYRRFCDATNRPYPKNPAWDRKYFDRANFPVLNVSWNDAEEFAAWAGKRLPSDQEWEKAARGPEGRLYPWGNWSQSTAANLKGTEDGHAYTAPVGSFPYDESPFGVVDMEGNVEEWVATDFATGKKVVRGGGFTSVLEQANTTSRRGESPDLDALVFSNIGFRCAADPDAARKQQQPPH